MKASLATFFTKAFVLTVSIAALHMPSDSRAQEIISGASTSHLAPWRHHAVAPVNDSESTPRHPYLEKRGSIVDSLIGVPVGFTVDGKSRANTNVSGSRLVIPELPVEQADVVAIASFTSFSVHITPSRRSLYTLALLKAEHFVIGKEGNLSPNAKIPVLLLGGSAVLSSGESIAFGIPNIEYSIVPGHRYLVFLKYNVQGNFYDLIKTWDLTNGTASPNSPEDEMKTTLGSSEANGKTETELLSSLDKKMGR
jgi:hypothetical protein